jgi:hypothetical protein
MSSYSANDIIEKALVKARINGPGETVGAPIAASVYDSLNDLLESWSLESLIVLYLTSESVAMVAGQSEYTWSTEAGTDISTERPTNLKDETFIREASVDYRVRLKSLDEFRRIRTKSTGARPRIIAYDPGYPSGTVHLWPAPTSTNSIYFRSEKQVTSFPDRTTSVDLPPGYGRLIILGLAIEICPDFGKKVPPALATLFTIAQRVVKRKNTLPRKRQMTPELAGMAGTNRGVITDIRSGPFL